MPLPAAFIKMRQDAASPDDTPCSKVKSDKITFFKTVKIEKIHLLCSFLKNYGILMEKNCFIKRGRNFLQGIIILSGIFANSAVFGRGNWRWLTAPGTPQPQRAVVVPEGVPDPYRSVFTGLRYRSVSGMLSVREYRSYGSGTRWRRGGQLRRHLPLRGSLPFSRRRRLPRSLLCRLPP